MRGTVLYGARDVRYEEVPEGGHVSFVGVPHDMTLTGEELFWSMVHLHGGPAPVRRSLQHLSDSLFGIVFVASTKVINNWRASWNTQRLAIRVSWFRDSASGL